MRCIKPRYARLNRQLIKATAPLERPSIDFKGPLPSNSQNKKMLTNIVIDEYSRFPFAFACKDMTSLYIFGSPMYIHSNSGTSFISQELTQHLVWLGIACNRNTPFNPQSNGQVDCLIGTLENNPTKPQIQGFEDFGMGKGSAFSITYADYCARPQMPTNECSGCRMSSNGGYSCPHGL